MHKSDISKQIIQTADSYAFSKKCQTVYLKCFFQFFKPSRWKKQVWRRQQPFFWKWCTANPEQITKPNLLVAKWRAPKAKPAMVWLLGKVHKFCKIFTLLLTVCTVVKSKVKISQNLWPSQNIWTLLFCPVVHWLWRSQYMSWIVYPKLHPFHIIYRTWFLNIGISEINMYIL